MIISRTPFRISFVGGGTDLRSFYSEEQGQVLSTAIDKFVYVVVKRQIGIVEYKYRINWSQVEFKNRIEDIEHPIVREALRFMKIDFPIEITTFSDVPAGSGLGSSSSFAVGLMSALSALRGKLVTNYQLAESAAQIEIEILKRSMGKQDHYAAAYGDLNVFTFHGDEKVTVEPVFYNAKVLQKIASNLLLFYTGKKRNASEILKKQDLVTSKKMSVLRQMKNLVEPLRDVILSGKNLHQIGEILHENWELKRSLTDLTSSKEIDEIYLKALRAGAIGGKLLGAGGGGFLIFYVEPDKHESVIKALSGLYQMKFRFDTSGTRITYYDQSTFSD
jgi:D-glycero-alpha-D-manno-heptose-7-phosphate kinase